MLLLCQATAIKFWSERRTAKFARRPDPKRTDHLPKKFQRIPGISLRPSSSQFPRFLYDCHGFLRIQRILYAFGRLPQKKGFACNNVCFSFLEKRASNANFVGPYFLFYCLLMQLDPFCFPKNLIAFPEFVCQTRSYSLSVYWWISKQQDGRQKLSVLWSTLQHWSSERSYRKSSFRFTNFAWSCEKRSRQCYIQMWSMWKRINQ